MAEQKYLDEIKVEDDSIYTLLGEFRKHAFAIMDSPLGSQAKTLNIDMELSPERKVSIHVFGADVNGIPFDREWTNKDTEGEEQ